MRKTQKQERLESTFWRKHRFAVPSGRIPGHRAGNRKLLAGVLASPGNASLGGRLLPEGSTDSAPAAGGSDRLQHFRRSRTISCNNGIYDLPTENAHKAGSTRMRVPVAEFEWIHQTIASLALHRASQIFDSQPIMGIAGSICNTCPRIRQRFGVRPAGAHASRLDTSNRLREEKLG